MVGINMNRLEWSRYENLDAIPRLHRGKIDYKQLRKINPEAARAAVIEYLKTNDHNVSEAAFIFGINRSVVYDIISKEKEGDLTDRSRAPRHQPGKTPEAIEDRVIEVKSKTRFGPERLSRYLKRNEGITIPAGTIRHIVRRNKKKIDYRLSSHRVRKDKREFVDPDYIGAIYPTISGACPTCLPQAGTGGRSGC